MSIGSQVASAQITGSGNYARPGIFKRCKITNVAVFNGQTDNIPNYVVEFQVGEFVPGTKADGSTVPASAHPPGSTCTFHSKLRPDIARSVLGNLKAFCLAVFKQKAEDVGQDSGGIREQDLDPKFIDEAILCNNSKIVGLEMDFEVFEKPNVKDKTKATSRFKWFIRKKDGAIVSA